MCQGPYAAGTPKEITGSKVGGLEENFLDIVKVNDFCCNSSATFFFFFDDAASGPGQWTESAGA